MLAKAAWLAALCLADGLDAAAIRAGVIGMALILTGVGRLAERRRPFV